jgi:hypothetical protein
MRLAASACALLLACASRNQEKPAQVTTALPGTPPPVATPAPARAPDPGPSPAAASPERNPAGGGSQADDAPCAKDGDCGETRVPAGGCCPTLCTPRVVTRRRAAALEANAASCNAGRACAELQCAPQRVHLVPVCQAGRCAGREETMQ